MIHAICRCPFCRDVCGLDDQGLKLVHDGGKPCRHSAFISVGLDACFGKRLVKDRSRSLLWVRGEGTRRLKWPGVLDPLDAYVEMLATNIIPGCPPLLSPEDLPAGVEYEVAGGTASERESVRRGSGVFIFTGRGGRRLTASLDGWGIYAQDPDGVVAAVREVVSSGQGVG